jgi:alpha-tubulin suppressor-like RCC1 family protein
MARWWLAAALALAACPLIPSPPRSEVASFEVGVEGVYTSFAGQRTPLAVVATCAARYDGGQAAVPPTVRGKQDCRYVIPRGAVEVDYVGRALTAEGNLAEGFSGPVSVRVIPGDFADPVEWSGIAAGNAHVASVRADGTLWTWGDNSSGQLGDGTNVAQGTPLPVAPEARWKTIAAGTSFTAGLRSDGTLWAYGAINGQLSADTDFTALAAGANHLLALKRDGTLWAAGQNESGQLGDGTTTARPTLVLIGGGTFKAIAAGGRHSLAVHTDGTLWAWGSNDEGQLALMVASTTTPTQADASPVWRTVSAGHGHSLAIRTDGTLWAWGRNDQAQLGLGTTTTVRVPTRVGALNGWDSVSAGVTHSVGLRQPGVLYSWGRNAEGELGDGTTTQRTTPQPVGLANDWAQVSAGDGFSVGLKDDGSVNTWGRNLSGQLGYPLPLLRDGGVDPFRRTAGRVRTAGYENRWRQAVGGLVRGVTRVAHQYGQARVWLENAPPKQLYDGGYLIAPDRLPPADTAYSFAVGSSPIIWFEEQTLATLNTPDTLDNRSSPFVGEFVRVGTPPEMGEVLRQTCPDDPERNGQPMAMVVTGVEPTGFYVSDISACRQKELLQAGGQRVRTPEPPEPCRVTLPDGGVANIEDVPGARDGRCAISKGQCSRRDQCFSYAPGTFAGLFVFNFSFPEGLNQGDLLFSLSGAVQEFTSTTQMTFPSWTIAERVRLLPPSQWNKWLDLVPPVEVNYRICGTDNVFGPFITDALCGQSSTNLKLESLEAALVKVRNVKFPDRFVNCDFDANGSVPFFCNRTDLDPMGNTVRSWGNCDFDSPPAPEPENERLERVCTQDCTLGRGPNAATVCAEESTFIGFGQYTVELAPPGPAWANLDDSSPARTGTANVTLGMVDGGVVAVPGRVSGLYLPVESGFEAGTWVAAVCDVPVRWKAGDSTVVATDADPLLEARTVLKTRMPVAVPMMPVPDTLSFLPTTASGRCYASINPRMRLNLDTKDSIPELNPDCRTDDPDPAVARQCRFTKGATYDVVGHLKQVQPARPRWIVIPRDPDDVCCYPGPGLECPRPLRACPGAK